MEDTREVQDTSDYKLDKRGKKIKAHRLVFNKGEDDGKKGVSEQMKKTFNTFVEQHTPELTEEQLNELVAELQEVLGKDQPAGKWISDFVHSDNPKFAGKSKEKRKQMALAAYYSSQRNEELKGGQVKLDKNKNGKLDKKDFEMLRKEELDEQLHPEADKVLKHIKPEHRAKYAAHLANGVYKGDFADRTAVLKAAKAAGHLNEELDEIDMPLNESYDPADYEAGHEKSQFGGYRAKLTNKKTGKDSYLGGTAYHKPEHAKGEAEVYRTSYNHSGKSHPGATYSHDKAISAYRKKAKEAGHVSEALLWPGTPEYKKKFDTDRVTGAGARHDIKKTATGVIATRRFSDNDTAEKPKDAPKRGRGRPKKDKFAEAVEFLMSLDETTFDSFMEEGFDTFMESFENLDEVSKTTLGSYIKKASRDATITRKIGADFEHQANKARSPGMKAASTSLADKWKSKSWKRSHNIDKAVDRLSK